MDPKVLFLLPGLVASPTKGNQAEWHAVAPLLAMPVYEWPVHPEQPEKTDPPHGEGSGESVMFTGINTNTFTNASGRLITVDSGASGSQIPYATWLPQGLNLVTDVSELGVEPMPPAALIHTANHIGPKHFTGPSGIKVRRSYTRRRG